MKFLFYSLISILMLAVAACSNGSNSIGSPGGGKQEDPVPCGSVRVSWTPPTKLTNGEPLVDLARYKIYMGFESGVYSDQIEVNDPTLDTYELTDLEFGLEYYMVITAVRANGIESDYSNQVVKLVDTCPAFMSFAQPTAHHEEAQQ